MSPLPVVDWCPVTSPAAQTLAANDTLAQRIPSEITYIPCRKSFFWYSIEWVAAYYWAAAVKEVTEKESPEEEDLGKVIFGLMGFCICPLETPARLLWSTSFFRHKLMLF
ncbi:hypothetical protein ACH5RR_014412 [Cinchona calisaya]|uniref:Uncharacterized protein n=1 Tax=Cinchona calisaya TaxID=153742 RepID=A0ABD3A2R9_9GENT